MHYIRNSVYLVLVLTSKNIDQNSENYCSSWNRCCGNLIKNQESAECQIFLKFNGKFIYQK